MTPTPAAVCARCGEFFEWQHEHTDGTPSTTISLDTLGSSEALMYWCDRCAEMGGTLGAVVHICADGDAMGFGGHHAFIEDITEADIERALAEVVPAPPTKEG
jgi:hypothetical protein